MRQAKKALVGIAAGDTTKPLPLVGILMGSDSDWPTMKLAADACAEFGVGTEVRVMSAHRTPDDVGEFPSSEAVIDIISHPSLEAQVGDLADRGTTIEEGLINAAYFRDVSMHGNHSSIWKKILKLMVGELTEGGNEFGGFHVKWVIGDG